jgi:hypothetical protein
MDVMNIAMIPFVEGLTVMAQAEYQSARRRHSVHDRNTVVT